MRFFILIFSISLLSCEVNEPLSITFTGDVILDRGVSDETAIHGDTLLSNSIRPFLNTDFNIINLETVLTSNTESNKQYAFRYDPGISTYLQRAQVSHASVANNHSYDYGMTGFEETIFSLSNNKIASLGSSCNVDILSKHGLSVGVLAASLTSDNDHLCIRNKDKLQETVISFIKKNPDVPLIVYVHWGLEYQRNPEAWQVDFAHRLVDLGVAMIIGHHPHVFQNIEYYKDKAIVYSLGNFVADAYLPNTTKGAIANVSLYDSELKLSIKPVELESYFPKDLSYKEQIVFLMENLKYSNQMCYYRSEDQWFIKNVSDVNFEEKASEWLFHVRDEDQVSIKKMSNGSHRFSYLKSGELQKSIAIHGEISEIEIDDVNNDHEPEILLGITKKVNFDRRERKRLNIFKIESNGIKVVWLGTKFLHDLQSYQVVESDHLHYLQTVEKDSLNQTHRAIYQWDEFGFALKTITNINESI
ncbi:MAG: CapA family protein [Cyclobacteriaceae bacterium]